MKHKILFTRQDKFTASVAAWVEFKARNCGPNENSFMILAEAVTKWVAENEEGMRLHESAARDTNIGDIGSFMDQTDDPTLEPYGIRNLNITIMDGQDGFSYDAHLVDEGYLEDHA